MIDLVSRCESGDKCKYEHEQANDDEDDRHSGEGDQGTAEEVDLEEESGQQFIGPVDGIVEGSACHGAADHDGDEADDGCVWNSG